MTGVQKLIVYLNYFGMGLLTPVFSLFLLSHGCDQTTLPLVFGLYSATVILVEAPSGMYADLRGRKRAYFVSAALTFGGLAVMYRSHGLAELLAGIAVFGVGAAFFSGSLESLIIESCIRRKGVSALPEAASSLLMNQCAGIGSGALVCAAVPGQGGYRLHILARLSLLLLSALLCALFLKEEAAQSRGRTALGAHIKRIGFALKGQRVLQMVLLCVFGGGLSLFALEMYWQPRLLAILTHGQNSAPGILCAVGYGGNLLGSFLAGRMKAAKGAKSRQLYPVCVALTGCALSFLALQNKPFRFMLGYVLLMTLLGMANVPEQSLLNAEASDETRASLLSVASLCAKLSGVLGAAICAALVGSMGIKGTWLLMGGATALAAIAAKAMGKGRAQKR